MCFVKSHRLDGFFVADTFLRLNDEILIIGFCVDNIMIIRLFLSF